VLAGGFGAAITEKLSDNNYNCCILRIGIENKFIEHGSIEELYSELGWLPEQLAKKIIERLNDRDDDRAVARSFIGND